MDAVIKPPNAMRKTLTLLIALTYTVLAQTTVDLGRQARNIDFSNSPFTKTFKTGTALPSTCSQGETYLKLDAQTGQNITPAPARTFGRNRACPPRLNLNLLNGPGPVQRRHNSRKGPSGSATASQILRQPVCLRCKVRPQVLSGSTPLRPASIVAAHNLGAGNLNVSGTGYTVDALGNGFPASSLPFYRCPVTSGVLPVSCTDLRAPLSANSVTAGPSGAVSVDCSPGNTCIVDLMPAAVPMTTSANAFSGLNSFSHLRLPAGSTPDSLQCASSGDAGKVWIQTDATSGRQLYICEGAAGWRLQGAPVNISTTSNIGYTASLPIGMPLAAQTSVTSANQIRLVLTAVSNPVQIARLAAWIATASVGGKTRVGIYKTDGTLVAQTAALDTGSVVVRDSSITPVVLDPGYYYFAWSVDNTTAKLAGSGTGTMTGLFNRVAASPGQATCTESMTTAGLPATCTIAPWPDTDGFPVIAVAGFAQ